MQELLEQMTRIDRMERGKLCKMGTHGHYNHQIWQDGRNKVSYVPANQAVYVQQALDGYTKFMKLAGQYVDEVIKQTQKERRKIFPRPKRKSKRQISQEE